jgi:hypothetical protein
LSDSFTLMRTSPFVVPVAGAPGCRSCAARHRLERGRDVLRVGVLQLSHPNAAVARHLEVELPTSCSARSTMQRAPDEQNPIRAVVGQRVQRVDFCPGAASAPAHLVEQLVGRRVLTTFTRLRDLGAGRTTSNCQHELRDALLIRGRGPSR